MQAMQPVVAYTVSDMSSEAGCKLPSDGFTGVVQNNDCGPRVSSIESDGLSNPFQPPLFVLPREVTGANATFFACV